MNRTNLIEHIKKYAITKDYVYAMWLEGADGLNKVDEYSDLDIWFDVEDTKRNEFIKELKKELSKLSEIDTQVDIIKEDIYQSNIHLKNTSEYLTIDLCAQNDSRSRAFTCYMEGSIAEYPKVIFDKKNIITYKQKEEIDDNLIRKLYEQQKNRILQYSRITKYIKRKNYLECYMEYEKQILKPIVIIMRLKYTPEIYDYDLCHISRHLPKKTIKQIEKLYKVETFNQIKKNIKYALSILNEYEKERNN